MNSAQCIAANRRKPALAQHAMLFSARGGEISHPFWWIVISVPECLPVLKKMLSIVQRCAIASKRTRRGLFVVFDSCSEACLKILKPEKPSSACQCPSH
jgi:hypothetical protein